MCVISWLLNVMIIAFRVIISATIDDNREFYTDIYLNYEVLNGSHIE